MPIRYSNAAIAYAAGYTNLELSRDVLNGDTVWELIVHGYYNYYYILIL